MVHRYNKLSLHSSYFLELNSTLLWQIFLSQQVCYDNPFVESTAPFCLPPFCPEDKWSFVQTCTLRQTWACLQMLSTIKIFKLLFILIENYLHELIKCFEWCNFEISQYIIFLFFLSFDRNRYITKNYEIFSFSTLHVVLL